MPARFGEVFTERRVKLVTGGEFNFDAVNGGASVIATVSTSRALTSSGGNGSGKLMKIRADMFFHGLVAAPQKLMIFTEACMHRLCLAEQRRGRAPHDVQFYLVELPRELALALGSARKRSSDEVRPSS